MVSGILIARPEDDDRSKVSVSKEKSSATSGSVEADGTAAQVPVGGGVAAGGTSLKEFGLTFVPKTPFIYGFRLRECFYKKKEGFIKGVLKRRKASC